MKKTRFFYEMNYFLIVLLGWLLLFGKAGEVNRKEKNKGMAEETISMEGKREQDKEERFNILQSFGISSAGIGLSLKWTEAEDGKTDGKTGDRLIRVLLTDSDQKSYYHPSVTLQIHGEERTYTFDSPEVQGKTLILKGDEDGIAVPSIKRAQNPPVYYGTLEIKKTGQGLLLINELPLETYLKGVVPSEMPSAYEEQALMAQAVCARTYAVCQMEENSLQEEYGADVDDSVNYQVYGNFAADEKTNRAVEKTKGQILCQNGKPITAYYFSTSAGQTSTDEIWGADKAAAYLKSVECDFDQDMPWSSWNVEIPWQILENRAAESGGDGSLKGIQIEKKSTSGAVTGIKVITENRTIQIEGEYEIRQFLSPAGLSVTEKDGTVVKGGSLLPSSYFDLKVKLDQMVQILGKGYGHGIGMSQNGANEMAKEGYTWREILTYFFQNITLESME